MAEALIGLLGIIVGGFIGSVTTLRVTRLTQKGEADRQRERDEQAARATAALRLRESSAVVMQKAMDIDGATKRILFVHAQKHPHQMDPDKRRSELVELMSQNADDLGPTRATLMLDTEGLAVLEAFDRMRDRYRGYTMHVGS